MESCDHGGDLLGPAMAAVVELQLRRWRSCDGVAPCCNHGAVESCNDGARVQHGNNELLPGGVVCAKPLTETTREVLLHAEDDAGIKGKRDLTEEWGIFSSRRVERQVEEDVREGEKRDLTVAH